MLEQSYALCAKKRKQSHYPRTFTNDFEPQTSAENLFLA